MAIPWASILKYGIPLGLGIFGASRGGPSKQEKRVAASQEDILNLYADIMQMRNRLTGPYEDEQGNLAGPMVDALMMAMNNAQRASSQVPRSVVNAAPFNPFGPARPPQRFSAPAQPDLSALMSFLGQGRR